MNDLLKQIHEEASVFLGKGQVAQYIPALATVDPMQFGIAICDANGKTYSYGDAETPFSIQSISKVFSLTLAMHMHGDEIWHRVGREPSGLPFNSLVQLEHEQGIPRNPFINAGALVISDMVESSFASPELAVRDFVRTLSGNSEIRIDRKIAESEYAHRARNAAMAYLMQSFENFNNDVEKVLMNYFSTCALKMTCVELAKSFSYLANKGVNITNQQRILTERQTKQVNALMATSGLYDEAGRFAFEVGLPGKSGVGGGIVAIVPGVLSVCVWSPALNATGNSLVGVEAMKILTNHIDWSVY
ncbi:glutaminase B [Thalassotalea sp. M1531]|uniref:Glutaminase n=1 Tax=Thalassotalea algicola TaxID=2716224 RepID=A0A7Y0LC63_9GAMM|nr:glutaminase B [Thalassotalea algicola]NMP31843.1 glutaminase B [Thalassotalea algicola]